MHTHRCVLIEISMEIGMSNFWLGLLVTALMKETYFSECKEQGFCIWNNLAGTKRLFSQFYALARWILSSSFAT